MDGRVSYPSEHNQFGPALLSARFVLLRVLSVA
jgi:hypothetical protein